MNVKKAKLVRAMLLLVTMVKKKMVGPMVLPIIRVMKMLLLAMLVTMTTMLIAMPELKTAKLLKKVV